MTGMSIRSVTAVDAVLIYQAQSGCTCPKAWWGICPPPCPVHNPPAPMSGYRIVTKSDTKPCRCTGACRDRGYCPVNPPQRPPALRPDEV